MRQAKRDLISQHAARIELPPFDAAIRLTVG
jgi:hypothetical protein